MDYKNRKYYLVALGGYAYDFRLNILKREISSLKISAPYNHFRDYKSEYDGQSMKKINKPTYWQMMISCSKEHEEILLYELGKAQRRDFDRCNWFELTKEVCGQ